MNANKLKFWQITGNGIQQNRTTHGSHWCTIFEIYQAMSNLHLNGDIQLHTLGVERVVPPMVIVVAFSKIEETPQIRHPKERVSIG